jgi:uncharacterized protein (DUF433 family)
MEGRFSLNLPADLKQEAKQAAERQGISLNQFILWSLTEKVTALRSKLDDPNYPAITYRLDTDNQPVPVVRGRGIRVQTIVITHHHWHESEADIAREYDLPLPAVKEALAFYQAHKSLVDALIAENDALESRHDPS